MLGWDQCILHVGWVWIFGTKWKTVGRLMSPKHVHVLLPESEPITLHWLRILRWEITQVIQCNQSQGLYKGGGMMVRDRDIKEKQRSQWEGPGAGNGKEMGSSLDPQGEHSPGHTLTWAHEDPRTLREEICVSLSPTVLPFVQTAMANEFRNQQEQEALLPAGL